MKQSSYKGKSPLPDFVIDAGLGFKDGALAYERSPARHRPNAPLGPAH